MIQYLPIQQVTVRGDRTLAVAIANRVVKDYDLTLLLFRS